MVLYIVNSLAFPDYKRTSLRPYIEIFEKFLKGLESSRRGKMIEQSGENISLNYYSPVLKVVTLLKNLKFDCCN